MPSGRVVVRLAAALAVCLWASPARAQSRFDHWTADNGLPQNSVRDILQTRDGYLWFTTFDGLVRFDGVRFTVFNKSSSPGIASNRFIALFEDRAGDLWAALETGEVVRRRDGRFTTYTQADGLPAHGFAGFRDDGHGDVVVLFGLFGNPYERNLEAVHLAYRLSGDRFEPAEELNSTFTGPATLFRSPHGASFEDTSGAYWLVLDVTCPRHLPSFPVPFNRRSHVRRDGKRPCSCRHARTRRATTSSCSSVVSASSFMTTPHLVTLSTAPRCVDERHTFVRFMPEGNVNYPARSQAPCRTGR